MEMKLYAPKNGPIDPLTVTNKPGIYSLTTAAENLLRMELMQKMWNAWDEGEADYPTAEESFRALDEIPFQERMEKVRRYEWDMKGNDPDLVWMYERKPYLDKTEELIPVEQVYKSLEGETELTDEEILRDVKEMLEEYPLNPFLEEQAGPAYWD